MIRVSLCAGNENQGLLWSFIYLYGDSSANFGIAFTCARSKLTVFYALFHSWLSFFSSKTCMHNVFLKIPIL